MDFVDEQYHVACFFHGVERRLESFLKFAAIFRAGNDTCHIEGEYFFPFQRVGHLIVDDLQRKPFGYRRFSDARLADKYGIVFRPSAKNLDYPFDFLIPTDDGIELVFFRLLRKVDSETFQFFQRAALRFLVGAFEAGGFIVLDAETSDALIDVIQRVLQFFIAGISGVSFHF